MADNSVDFSSLEGKASLLDEIMSGDLREKVLETLSEKHPDVIVPEVRLKKSLDGAIADLEKNILSKVEETLKEREFNDSLSKQRQAVESRGYKIEDVEKTMKDRRIGSYETAMEFLDQEKRLAPATPVDHREVYGIGLPEGIDKLGKSLAHGGVNNFARDSALKALDDIRNGRMTK